MVSEDGEVPPPDTPGWVPLRRLTNQELRASVFLAFHTGEEWNDNAMRRFFKIPEPEPGDVFRNHTPELTVGVGVFTSLLEGAERFARAYASWGPSQPEALVDCEGLEREGCIDRFIGERGQQLYRRPLLAQESASLRAVYDEAAAAIDEDAGYEALIVAMVMSPQTLYLLESEEPELHPWHVASRLAFYLWRLPPDAALMEKAADGTLLQEAVYGAEVDRMMADDRFYAAQGEFFLELLDLSRFDAYYKDRSLDDTLDREGMRLDFIRNVRRFYEADGTFEDLLGDELEFTDPLMVAFYREGTYPGILAHPVFTWTHSGYRKNSPIERGVTVLERLILCDHLPPPPMNVEPVQAPDESATLRERLAVHRENASCAACHDAIDPIGLTFEAYDWFGGHHTREFWNDPYNGHVIVEEDESVDTSGALVNTDNDGPVADLGELGERMGASQDVQQCFVDQSLRYASLRLLDESDDGLRRMLMERFTEHGLKLRSLVREIALSPVVRYEQETQP